MNIQLLTLKTFSATGGIEKVTRLLGKVLVDEFTPAHNINITSLHDTGKEDTQGYFDQKYFSGLGNRKLSLLFWLLTKARTADILILSHSNLLKVVGWVKTINKNCKIILIAHGIEVWKPVKNIQLVDAFAAVSQFTAAKLMSENAVAAEKITVINNCLDPFLKKAASKEFALEKKIQLGIEEDQLVLFALTRLATTERHKGYDKVIRILGKIRREKGLAIYYVLAGKFTEEERQFIIKTTRASGMEGLVHLVGFVADEDLPVYFKLADAYILPSKKEGFGITFIEAMHYGLPVIAGNQDGSVDALLNGALGTLVNPDDENEIEAAILNVLSNPLEFVPNEELVEHYFGYKKYKNNWKGFLGNFLDTKYTKGNKEI